MEEEEVVVEVNGLVLKEHEEPLWLMEVVVRGGGGGRGVGFVR